MREIPDLLSEPKRTEWSCFPISQCTNWKFCPEICNSALIWRLVLIPWVSFSTAIWCSWSEYYVDTNLCFIVSNLKKTEIICHFSAQTVGVIVRLEREIFQVLNMNGKVVEVKPQALHKKKEYRNTIALDSDQQTIQRRDIVKVIDGPHSVSTDDLVWN